jgi:SAM-dependent methyltransferase
VEARRTKVGVNLSSPSVYETQPVASAVQRPQLRDVSANSLLSYLEQVAEDFPDEVRPRGIHRNWNDYRFLLRQISVLMRSSAVIPTDYLDLGSGAAVIPSVMALAGLRVTAVDTWAEYAAELDNLMGTREQFAARFNRLGVRWTEHDILKPPLPFPSLSFDMISLFAVLEHLPRPAIALAETVRLLRPGGLLLVTIPNVANLRNRLRLLIGQSPHADSIDDWFGPTFFGHYREMTLAELTRILRRSGFSIVSAQMTNACHWNTRLEGGRWGKDFGLTSAPQAAKLLYLLVTSFVPGLRYEIFVAARKCS